MKKINNLNDIKENDYFLIYNHRLEFPFGYIGLGVCKRNEDLTLMINYFIIYQLNRISFYKDSNINIEIINEKNYHDLVGCKTDFEYFKLSEEEMNTNILMELL